MGKRLKRRVNHRITIKRYERYKTFILYVLLNTLIKEVDRLIPKRIITNPVPTKAAGNIFSIVLHSTGKGGNGPSLLITCLETIC
jgi:hypothetical protein